jgi:hypothetical protein
MVVIRIISLNIIIRLYVNHKINRGSYTAAITTWRYQHLVDPSYGYYNKRDDDHHRSHQIRTPVGYGVINDEVRVSGTDDEFFINYDTQMISASSLPECSLKGNTRIT